MALVDFSSSAFSSSGEKMTYWPLVNSYPFTISSFSTFSPSFEQTYCCFKRAPSFLWSQLKAIAAEDSPVENILTGTETRPKDRVAEPMGCALIDGSVARGGPMVSSRSWWQRGSGGPEKPTL